MRMDVCFWCFPEGSGLGRNVLGQGKCLRYGAPGIYVNWLGFLPEFYIHLEMIKNFILAFNFIADMYVLR